MLEYCFLKRLGVLLSTNAVRAMERVEFFGGEERNISTSTIREFLVWRTRTEHIRLNRDAHGYVHEKDDE